LSTPVYLSEVRMTRHTIPYSLLTSLLRDSHQWYHHVSQTRRRLLSALTQHQIDHGDSTWCRRWLRMCGIVPQQGERVGDLRLRVNGLRDTAARGEQVPVIGALNPLPWTERTDVPRFSLTHQDFLTTPRFQKRHTKIVTKHQDYAPRFYVLSFTPRIRVYNDCDSDYSTSQHTISMKLNKSQVLILWFSTSNVTKSSL